MAPCIKARLLENVKSEKPCSIADLTHFRSRDVYQTYAIRLPDGGLRMHSRLCSAEYGRLASFHMPELVSMGRLIGKIRQVRNFAPLTAVASSQPRSTRRHLAMTRMNASAYLL